MRKIEFRWKDSTGQWIHGNLLVLLNHPVVFVPEVLEETGEVLKETLGQWTGLSDIDEKRIFEGDVVEMKCSINTNLTGVVMFVNEVGCYAVYREDGYGLFVTDARFFRLLGNIFDDEKFHQRFWPVWQKGSQYLMSKVKGPTK